MISETFDEFKTKGRALYRQFLKEDLHAMKNLLEGARIVGLDEELEWQYKVLAANVRSWKKLIKLNQ